MKNYIKYFAALLLFGFNGIVASRITLTSYEIVYLRTFIESMTVTQISGAFCIIGGAMIGELFGIKREKYHIG